MIPRFIHDAANGIISFSLMSNIPLCICNTSSWSINFNALELALFLLPAGLGFSSPGSAPSGINSPALGLQCGLSCCQIQ